MGYCDSGVNDAALMRDVGTRLGVEAAKLEEFALAHADFVVLTSDFPEEKDRYWPERNLRRADCEAIFGKFDDKTLRETREFSIVDAQQRCCSSSREVGSRDAAPRWSRRQAASRQQFY